ncbi:tetratricopeptide repeat protein [Aneurinibacillus tyrosinisolvens]|uniref:tetratricopeptide repeat protein n=1 Tax=Aneurinibacillus tyrosinisolvens TaxID=1443435 RepID=UPI00063F1833|nr:tetratricopeptide repeat protein [Aneurinibacillus tyrosinisolvens]
MSFYKLAPIFWDILMFIFITWIIYKNFFKPIKRYEDYINRATNYEFFLRNKKKKMEILKTALNDGSLLNIERSSILIKIGFQYFKEDNWDQATKYFHDALQIARKEKFFYTKALSDVVKAYFYMGQRQKAIDLYYDLLQRQSYDPRFSKIKKLAKLLKLNQ